jgi:hypothetical protein
MSFTERELELRRHNRTTFYQTVVYQRLEDIIIDKQYKLVRACDHLGERWPEVKRFLSTVQKDNLDKLIKIYGRNGGKKLRRIATRPKAQA